MSNRSPTWRVIVKKGKRGGGKKGKQIDQDITHRGGAERKKGSLKKKVIYAIQRGEKGKGLTYTQDHRRKRKEKRKVLHYPFHDAKKREKRGGGDSSRRTFCTSAKEGKRKKKREEVCDSTQLTTSKRGDGGGGRGGSVFSKIRVLPTSS